MQLCKHKPSDCTCYSKQKCHLYSSKKLKKQKENREGKIHLSLSLSWRCRMCQKHWKKSAMMLELSFLETRTKSNLEKAKKKSLILLYKRDLFKHAQTKGGIIQCSTEKSIDTVSSTSKYWVYWLIHNKKTKTCSQSCTRSTQNHFSFGGLHYITKSNNKEHAWK